MPLINKAIAAQAAKLLYNCGPSLPDSVKEKLYQAVLQDEYRADAPQNVIDDWERNVTECTAVMMRGSAVEPDLADDSELEQDEEK